MNKPNYTAIWPGQPGGYVPKIAEEMAATAAARAQSAKAMAKGHEQQAQVAKAKRKATRDNRKGKKPAAKV